MYAKLFLLLLLTIPGMSIRHKSEKKKCKSITIECVCGIGRTRKFVPLELKMLKSNESATGGIKCSDYPDSYQACANISCFYFRNSSNSDVIEKGFISNFYPKEFTILRGDVIHGHRFARDTDTCHVSSLKNAEVKCWKYPKSVTCDIKCIYGYGLRTQSGTLTSSTVNCQLSENIWQPHIIYDCQPYVNCKVRLQNPGKVKCVEPLDMPAYCDISCAEYAQYEGSPLQRYNCADENFGNNLPYCVSLGQHVKLIQKP